MTREEAYALYSAKSKAGAAVCNAAYVAAIRVYDSEIAKARAARDRGEIDQKAVTAAMRHAAGRHDSARQRADAAYAALMRQAHEEYLKEGGFYEAHRHPTISSSPAIGGGADNVA